jgi:hypothetical protein
MVAQVGLTQILFRLPSVSVNTAEHPYLFEGDFLALEVLPSNYRKVSEDSYKVHRGFVSSVVEIQPIPYAFEATVQQGAEIIGVILQALIDEATENPLVYKLVECVDRHVPGDSVTRRGVLQFQPIGGAIAGFLGKQQREGYRIFFQEV